MHHKKETLANSCLSQALILGSAEFYLLNWKLVSGTDRLVGVMQWGVREGGVRNTKCLFVLSPVFHFRS